MNSLDLKENFTCLYYFQGFIFILYQILSSTNNLREP